MRKTLLYNAPTILFNLIFTCFILVQKFKTAILF